MVSFDIICDTDATAVQSNAPIQIIISKSITSFAFIPANNYARAKRTDEQNAANMVRDSQPWLASGATWPHPT